MIEIRRPLSEKNLGNRSSKELQRPNSSNQSNSQQKQTLQTMKSSIQLQKQSQNFYSKYFSYKDQKENIEIRSNQDRNQSSKQSPQEYQKLQDKLLYLENKIQSIKSHIDNSQRQTKNNLASKFFGQNTKNNQTSTSVQKTVSIDFTNRGQKEQQIHQQTKEQRDYTPVQQNKLKSSTLINNENKIEGIIIKKPSLSTFVTQVKAPLNENKTNFKNLRPESAKASNSIKENFRRKTSQEKNNETAFLYYFSSIIKGYMQVEINRPIELIREHLLQTMQASIFQKSVKIANSFEDKKVNLPSTNKKTIVFDLDETLIHCNESVQIPGDVILPIKFPSGEIIEASINIRPYAQQVLQTLNKHFEIIVFTASHSCYANVVIDYLDPNKNIISHRFFRDSCVQTEEGAYIKDLRVIGNRAMNDMVLVDNAAYSFCLQPLNGIPIINYYDNKMDQELLYLQNYVMSLRSVRDVRQYNCQNLKLDKLSQFSDPIELLQQLYKEYIP
ncbi:unnamed protein product (macronuclear) [Paramecium tetraurelia]|uniref:FCP1 homology domain-containing protein n=1 Tax=Paramecium tetraurelia TaxID=5888 RepID=A0E7V4_PARTE|nr:uncharacterized protein GSPATT00024099001 [Paramecium tetraurelia]CAK91371.1 unnamed protein product [Paramecium tetraurelia]|eukprot:XP_001458768.1 hypothetical protein (macronuclear) [Paramecium tetraurelia strain d4-2]